MEKVFLATLYFNNQMVTPGMDYWDSTLSFRKAIKNYEVPFYHYCNGFISSGVLCPGVPWDTLNSQGFITGKPVILDGIPYLCRSLKLGLNGARSEWDDILEAIGDDPALWGDENIAFWGQELKDEDCGVFTGGRKRKLSDRGWGTRTFHFKEVGFRPILEPLSKLVPINDLEIGTQISVYGENGSVTGVVQSISDYDLVLENTSFGGASNLPWLVREENMATINRDASVWVQIDN